MTCFVSHTSVDCRNAYELSEWWKTLLGYVDEEDEPNEPGHQECMIQSPDGEHRILFIEVPDAKSVKNRLHFDLRPAAVSRDEEVERVLALGATQIDDQRGKYGRSEEHTSELQSLMRNSYAVFCLKKKQQNHTQTP